MARRSYSDEVKAAAMAALLQGQSVNSVAKEYRIPEGTIKAWKRRSKGETDASAATPKKREIGELLVQVLTENLTTLRYIAQETRSQAWLMEQSAAELATFYGVMTDKAVRLIEAFGEAGE